MTDMLKDGAEWLANQRRAFMTRTVTYERGNDSVELPATIGQTDFNLTDDYGAAIRYVSRDFLIAVSDLVINGSMTLPNTQAPGAVVSSCASSETGSDGRTMTSS